MTDLKQAAQQPEPVAYMWRHIETGLINILPPNIFLDDGARWFCVGPLTAFVEGVRYAERAHNIGGGT